MSTPVVAGAVALVRQYFVEGWYPTGAAVAANAYTPSGPLLKAVMLGEIYHSLTSYESVIIVWPPEIHLVLTCSLAIVLCVMHARLSRRLWKLL
jgi:hypothetical protein